MEKIIESIVNVSSLAIGMAISPIPLVGFILIITSKKSKINSISYLIGWFMANISLMILGSIFYSNINFDNNSSSTGNIINFSLGVLLLIFGLYSIAEGIVKNKRINTPKWMQSVNNFSFLQSFLLSFTLMLVNFKNVFMGLDAGEIIVGMGLNGIDFIVVLLSLGIISSFTIVLFTIIFVIFKEKFELQISNFKNFLINNNKLIVGILFSFLGLRFILTLFSSILTIF